MKTSVNKKSYILLAILTIFVMSPFFTFGNAATDDFTFDIDEFKERIQSSPDDLWKKPGEKRKNNICNKLTELQQLIDEENFEDAYDKLLHDIKPKLTGLKQDEDGVPWGNGVYAQSWVTCDDLKAIFLIDCDLILDQINPLSVYDDDKTPPTISIVYEGGYYLANIGVWHVIIEDLESGIDEILIEINGIVFVNEINLDGAVSITYDNIALPLVIETHMIVVTAINNDKDNEWDQELGSETDWVEILEDNTAPIIEITYQGDNNDENPGTWSVDAFDDESGLNMASLEILIDGQFAGNDFDDYIVPYSPGEHSIHVEVENDDPLNPLLSELSKSTTIIDDDVDSPVIIFSYTGDGTDGTPGEIIVSASDNVGLSVDPSGTYLVPNTLGSHNFEFIATDNDDDRVSDSLTTTLSFVKVITDDDTLAPIISIIYSGSGFDDDAGYFNWAISDTDDEIGGDSDLGLSEIVVLGTYESTIGLPSEEFTLASSEIGTWNLPTFPGIYRLEVAALDNDDDRTLDVDALSSNLFQEQTIIDDDTSAPSISIQYSGDGNVINPGVWHVDVEDLESGLDTVVITVNGIEEVYDLQGEFYDSIDVPVPAIAQINTIEVIATNDDKDYVGDQETSTESDGVEIFADITPPTIIPPEDVEYEVGSIGNILTWVVSDEYPDTYEIFLDGVSFESGVWESGIPITINIDGFAVGTYEFMITCDDSYNNIATDSVYVTVIEDDDITPPTLLIEYFGTGDQNEPGIWIVRAKDIESGIDEIQIIVDGNLVLHEFFNGIQVKDFTISVPGAIGIHTIEVIATNNDNDWLNDQDTATMMDSVYIEPYIPPPPPIIIPDTSPPEITISYVGGGTTTDPGYWEVTVNDPQSGLEYMIFIVDGIAHTLQSQVPVPASEGSHTIEVYAMNRDGLTSSLQNTVNIPDYDVDPPEIILTPGTMTIEDGDAVDGVSIDWQIMDASGIGQASVLVNGVEIASYGLSDQGITDSYLLPCVPGIYTIDVIARDNDNDPEHLGDDWLESSARSVITIVDDDTTAPSVDITYTGEFYESDPGVWNVIIEDLESGLSEVIITIDGVVYLNLQDLNGISSKNIDDIPVPDTVGIHVIEIAVKNNDNDWISDQEVIEIIEFTEIIPDPEDPGEPPIIIG